MDKDIQEIRRRAGLEEQAYSETTENVLTKKDKDFLTHRIKEMQKKYRDWASLNRALVDLMMGEMERLYDEGYRDGQYDPVKKEGEGETNEAFGQQPSPEEWQRLRKIWKIPNDVPDAHVMKWINQEKAKGRSL